MFQGIECFRGEWQLVIVTGLSGAGKTQAIRCLEDLGFFCVDNLPPTMVPGFLDLIYQPAGQLGRVAIVMDIRGGRFFADLSQVLSTLEDRGYPFEILFLEASDEALVRRFKETRRRHPLAPHGGVLEGILEERRLLEELRGRASKIIDTSELSTRQLRQQILDIYGGGQDGRLMVMVMSFGFKYGIPLDADLVMDVRFLPNPHYVESLRPLTGHHREVQDYVMHSPATRHFLDKFTELLDFLLPYYIQEGKSHLVVAVGCTGGQHRSVTLANAIGEGLARDGRYRVSVQHRDVDRKDSRQ